MRDLPDMYTRGPRVADVVEGIKSGKSQMHILQLLCNTFIAIVIKPVG